MRGWESIQYTVGSSPSAKRRAPRGVDVNLYSGDGVDGLGTHAVESALRVAAAQSGARRAPLRLEARRHRAGGHHLARELPLQLRLHAQHPRVEFDVGGAWAHAGVDRKHAREQRAQVLAGVRGHVEARGGDVRAHLRAVERQAAGY